MAVVWNGKSRVCYFNWLDRVAATFGDNGVLCEALARGQKRGWSLRLVLNVGNCN